MTLFFMTHGFHGPIIEPTEAKLHKGEWEVKSPVGKGQAIINKLRDAAAIAQASMASAQDA